jgi:hypothetical protein
MTEQILNKLPFIKQRYIDYMIKLSLITNPVLTDFACQLILLLQNAINYKNNHVLAELDKDLSYILTSYIYDISNLINGQLDIEKYKNRHNTLFNINNLIKKQVTNNTCYLMHEFKEILLTIF